MIGYYTLNLILSISTSSSDNDLANKFADFFTEKITSLRNSLDSSSSTLVHPDDSSHASCSLSHFKNVTEAQVSSLITGSAVKSWSLDPAPAVVLKECWSVLLPVMTRIVNLSITTAVMPDCFKLAMLNPLLKKMGLDFEVFANFRPISNLMFMSKLTERAIALQLIDYITINNLDEVFQSAYKQLHSTETALLRVKMIF